MTQGFSEWIMLAIFIATIFGLIKYSQHSITVFSAAALSCLLLQFVSVDKVLVLASNKGLVTLICLLLVSYAIEKTSWLRKVSSILLSGSEKFATVKIFLLGALSSSVLNNTAVVATLIQPIRSNLKQSYSRLLVPLSFASIVGGTVTLIGTSTNLIVNSMLIERTGEGFSFFEFAEVGLAVALVVFVIALLTQKVLPNKQNKQNNGRSYLIEAEVSEGSNLVGKSIEQNGLRNLEQLFLVEVVRNNQLISPVSPSQVLQPKDKLIFSGDVKRVGQLKEFHGLEIFSEVEGLLKENLTEVLIKPNSVLVGRTLKQTDFRTRFDSGVVAIRREGEALSGKLGEIKLEVGDMLVLAVSPDFHKLRNLSKNFVIVSGFEQKSFISGVKEKLVLGGFLTSLLTSIVLDIDLLTCLVFYLAFLLASNSLSLNEIKRRFPIEILVIVTSALVIANSLNSSGLLQHFSLLFASNLDADCAVAGIIAVYISTWLMTELVTNNAAAALMFPLAFTLSSAIGSPVEPFIYAVVFGASCSFISPYGYQTNLMVFNAGQYKLKEFARYGWPVAIGYSATVILMLTNMV